MIQPEVQWLIGIAINICEAKSPGYLGSVVTHRHTEEHHDVLVYSNVAAVNQFAYKNQYVYIRSPSASYKLHAL